MAEQAEAQALQNVRVCEDDVASASGELDLAVADWQDFWSGTLSDPAWLAELGSRVNVSHAALVDAEQALTSAREEFERRVKLRTQETERQQSIGKRYRALHRAALNKRADDAAQELFLSRRRVMS